MIVVPFVGLLAGLAIPGLLRARQAAQRVRCTDNLRQIDSAKEQWAMENFASSGGDAAGADDRPPCLQRGFPECTAVGAIPGCDQESHVLER